MIRYWYEIVRPLVSMLSKMSGYVKNVMNKDRDKDKNKKNKLMFCCIDDDTLLEECKGIWTKIKDLQNMLY